ncbi:hypothetical protein XH93_12175 [Bradyrhizobium sp. CCBAU 51753]|nr:hypothetical protein XH93_12175 [Bradyrhizobium sp. CCBAU 51753]
MLFLQYGVMHLRPSDHIKWIKIRRVHASSASTDHLQRLPTRVSFRKADEPRCTTMPFCPGPSLTKSRQLLIGSAVTVRTNGCEAILWVLMKLPIV